MDSQRNNLPVQLSSFIGREREVSAVGQLLTQTRLLTLTGSGGVGKTRLSLQVAADLRNKYEDGVWFVELAALADPALVPQTVATALGVRQRPDQTLIQLLGGYLETRQLLLVLDNCEHLVLACAQLADALLQASADLCILATSREPLGIVGEVIFVVPGLSMPDPQRLPRAGSLAQYEAIHLFVERAKAVNPTFILSGDNALSVAQICARLDGIPLAIELAAARMRGLAPAQLQARMDDRFRLLTSSSRTAPARHQTLRAAMGWSHDLLDEAERILFRRLAVFAGGWTLEAAERIASDGLPVATAPTTASADRPPTERTLSTEDVLDLLTQLVNKSLVVAAEQNGELRYHFLETIGQFALERLQLSGELETLRRRHFEFFLQLALVAEPKIQGAEQLAWLRRLESEHANLRAALQWTLESRQTAVGVRMVSALGEFWPLSGKVGEGRAWFERFLAQPEAMAPTPTRAEALWGAGRFAEYLGDSALAHARFEESAQILRTFGDEAGLARVLRDLGYSLQQKREFAIAQPLLEESAQLFRNVGDRFGLAYALRYLGNMPDASYATRCLDESLVLFRGLQFATGIGAALLGLGDIASGQGRFSDARAYLEESLALRASVNDEFGVAVVCRALGNMALLQGDPQRARAYYDRALETYEKVAHPLHVAGALGLLALVALYKGEHAQPLPLLRRSLSLHRELAHPPGLVENLVGFACWAAVAGQLESAITLFGAVNAFLESTRLRLIPVSRMMHDRYLDTARSQLKAAPFAKAWDAGRRLTLDEALAEALGITIREQPSAIPPSSSTYPAGLTAREVEVLRLLAQGLTDAEIAATLVISPRTVNGHLRSIYSKLDVTNRTAAARYAAEFKPR